MYALLNRIMEDAETPAHLRLFLSRHVDEAGRIPEALFDVLSMVHTLEERQQIHQWWNHDDESGDSFGRLAQETVGVMQATRGEDELTDFVLSASQALKKLESRGLAVEDMDEETADAVIEHLEAWQRAHELPSRTERE